MRMGPVICALSIVSWCSSASAQIISQNVSGGIYSGGTFNLFDPSLGRLIAVSVTGNESTGAALFRNVLEDSSQLSVSTSDFGSLELNTGQTIATANLAGSENYAAGSASGSLSLSGPIDSVLSGSDIDAFIGANQHGTVFPFVGPVTVEEGAIFGKLNPEFSATITYYYGVLPEPGTWALMLMGFGAMGLLVRAKRGRRKLVTP